MDRQSEDQVWKKRLADAMRACYEGRLTQSQVASLIGVDQATVSNWARGVNQPSFGDVSRVERACNRPRGWVFTHAGFVDEGLGVPAAIAMDPRLSDAERLVLKGAYDGIIAAGNGGGNATNRRQRRS